MPGLAFAWPDTASSFGSSSLGSIGASSPYTSFPSRDSLDGYRSPSAYTDGSDVYSSSAPMALTLPAKPRPRTPSFEPAPAPAIGHGGYGLGLTIPTSAAAPYLDPPAPLPRTASPATDWRLLPFGL